MLTATQNVETFTEMSDAELRQLRDLIDRIFHTRSSNEEDVAIGNESNIELEPPTDPLTEQNTEMTTPSETNGELSSEGFDYTENQGNTTPKEESNDNQINEPVKNDIEIRLDEVYNIRVVANEVVNRVEELQNQLTVLQEQMGSMVSHNGLEDMVKNITIAELKKRIAEI